jgi:Polysaccharide deacetylase
MKPPAHAWLLACLMAVLVMAGWGTSMHQASSGPGSFDAGMVLLLPDAQAADHPVAQAWLDAAQEEGLDLQPMSDDAFVQALANHQALPGVVLPDTVHRQASDVLVNALYRYVQEGGQLLVVFDAASLDAQQGTYARPHSRLSRLVGGPYALYEKMGNDTTAQGPVYVSRKAEKTLAIQPGKLDYENTRVPDWGELTTYGYPTLSYSHYRTQPGEDSDTLIQSVTGDTIVSTHRHGQGSVLFANLPLGYLKTQTDSYLLHRLLSYFAVVMVGQPTLASTPNAQGGMVLNLHVDSNAAQAHLQSLEQDGWFDQGPYAIHITAGPDTYAPGDRMGIDLPHNSWMRGFLQRQHAKGHEIGNHGGWMHNVFGYGVTQDNRERFEPFLALNHSAVSLAIGERAISYSAPMGNQPDWVTDWLSAHDFKAYYSTADTGLGPTRSYIQGRRATARHLWAFPISNFKRIATIEELQAHQLTESEITHFIVNLLTYVSHEGVARLFYFHPPISKDYSRTLDILSSHARQLQRQGLFRWYSMGELSDFQNQRMAAQWQVSRAPETGKKTITASTASTLDQMTWLIPQGSTRTAPRITQGTGQVLERSGQWLIVAGDCQLLHIEWTDSV